MNFLEDLDELEEDVPNQQMEEERPSTTIQESAEFREAMAEFEFLKYAKPAETTGSLLNDQGFIKHMEKIRQIRSREGLAGVGSEEYPLIVKSNQFITVIDREVATTHKLVRDIYTMRFPELESLVLSPIDYCRCVVRIQNETDLNKVDFRGVLSNQMVVTVTVAGSSTSGKLLPQDLLEKALDGCDKVMKLNDSKTELLQYIESRMTFIAPNLTAIVGSKVAALLMTAAGGIEELGKMPACNIQVLGSQRKNMLGFSKATAGDSHLGFFSQLEIVQKAPPSFQIKLVRIFSTNCAKAIRIDVSKQSPSGVLGKKIYDDMIKRYEKITEKQAAKTKKPLARPDDKPRKKRGGRKYRNMRMKKAMTELRKYKNRLAFGAEGEEEIGMTGKGMGMVGKAGKIRVPISKQNKVSLSKKMQKNMQKNMGGKQLDGSTTSIIFSANEGIELKVEDNFSKPQPKAENYFKKDSGFRTVLEQKEKEKHTPLPNMMRKLD